LRSSSDRRSLLAILSHCSGFAAKSEENYLNTQLLGRLSLVDPNHLRRTVILIVALSLNSISLDAQSDPNAGASKLVASQQPVTDNYFGTKITDPFRWMEAGLSDPHFLEMLKGQNNATGKILSRLAAPRAKLLARIQAFDSAVAVTSDWRRAGGRIFYLEIAPGASDAELQVRESNESIRTLLDPAMYKNGEQHASIDYFEPSPDGNYLAAGISLGGSEDSTLHIFDVASGKALPESISRTQYGWPSWRSDSKSLFYFRQQQLPPNAAPAEVYKNGRTFLHFLGTDPEKDVPIFGPGLLGSPNVPAAGFCGVIGAPGSPYDVAIYTAGTIDSASVYVARERDVTGPDTPWKQILSSEDRMATGGSPAALFGSTLYVLSNKQSQNGSVLAFDLDHPGTPPKIVVPAGDALIDGVYAARDALYISGRHGVAKTLTRLSYTDAARVEPVGLPTQGRVYGIDATPQLSGIVFGIDSWLVPPTAYLYDSGANSCQDIRIQPKNPVDLSAFEAREVQVPSTEGAMIPVSIICRKDILLDGSHPTLFEGHGAYGVSIDPEFNSGFLPSIYPWVERGGVVAIAHVRGGGEFGERWHVSGQKGLKQHTVDDMIATARWLISNKYTSPLHLAIRGTSGGGIAVGNAIVQSPELFAAAIDNVGITNLLRFQFTPNGAGNIPEFGDVTKAAEFRWLYAMSAYHHIKDGVKYPAFLGLTGVNDPRVPSWLVAEFVARLQKATASRKPVLLRVDFDAGHLIGSNRNQREQSDADQETFLLWQLGDREFQIRRHQHAIPGTAKGFD
jgi:prolyl oligopeptidase